MEGRHGRIQRTLVHSGQIDGGLERRQEGQGKPTSGTPGKAKEEAVVGDGLAVVTVVGAASCQMPDWLTPGLGTPCSLSR